MSDIDHQLCLNTDCHYCDDSYPRHCSKDLEGAAFEDCEYRNGLRSEWIDTLTAALAEAKARGTTKQR